MRFSLILLLLACLASLGSVEAQALVDKNPPVIAMATSPDSSQVLTGSQAGVEVLLWPALKKETSLRTELTHVHDLSFSPDGKQLVVVGGAPGETGELKIWSWEEAKRIVEATPHKDLIYKAVWSPSGDRILTASADGTAKVLDANTLEELANYEGHSRAVLSAAWAPGDELAATSSVDQTIQLWEVATGKRVRALSNHVGSVNDLAFRPNAGEGPPILASISEDRTLRLWQPTIGRLMRFTKLPSPPRVVAWLPSGEHLLVGCNDGQLRIVDFEELKAVKEIAGDVGRIHAICLHPKEAKILVGGEKGVRAIELPSLNTK